jgi:hypothetical protein
MAETNVYEDDELIVWETVRGTPGESDYAVDRRTEHKPGTTEANRLTIEDQARQALVNNRTFVALATPTNAQVLAQTRALSRQVNGIIRMLLNQLDDTD